jgi:hypothetical protein
MPAMKALKPWVLVLRTILLILRQLLIIVGDNVGDVAGMGADLLGSYAGGIAGAM